MHVLKWVYSASPNPHCSLFLTPSPHRSIQFSTEPVADAKKLVGGLPEAKQESMVRGNQNSQYFQNI